MKYYLKIQTFIDTFIDRWLVHRIFIALFEAVISKVKLCYLVLILLEKVKIIHFIYS